MIIAWETKINKIGTGRGKDIEPVDNEEKGENYKELLKPITLLSSFWLIQML